MAKRSADVRAKKLGSPSSATIMAVCPFFHEARDRMVLCESPIPGSSVVYIAFPRQDEQIKHMRLYCCSGYRTCEIYMATKDAKYPDD